MLIVRPPGLLCPFFIFVVPEFGTKDASPFPFDLSLGGLMGFTCFLMDPPLSGEISFSYFTAFPTSPLCFRVFTFSIFSKHLLVGFWSFYQMESP